MANIGKVLLGLKVARENSEKTQKALADFIGVTVDTVKKYESGKKECKVSRIPKIMDFLNVNMPVLLEAPSYISVPSVVHAPR